MLGSLQVHLTYVSPTDVCVSWATGQGIMTAAPALDYAAEEAGPGNTVWYGTAPGNYTHTVTSGHTTFYNQVRLTDAVAAAVSVVDADSAVSAAPHHALLLLLKC